MDQHVGLHLDGHMDGHIHERDWLAQRFEEQRPHLRAVAYRMLGSLAEADDAVQEAWLRLSRAASDDIANLGGWLTTVVARICLNLLRARTARREDSLDAIESGGTLGSWTPHLPDPIVSPADGIRDPEQAALLSDAVGLALLVVLDTLDPAARVAFVLHDVFAVPFEDIAAIVGRSPDAARQLASRARRRVRGAAPVPDPDVARQWHVANAFLAAAHSGDFTALLAVLDPDVVLRADRGAAPGAPAGGLTAVHGAAAVAGQALTFARFAYAGRLVLVNGGAGIVSIADGHPVAVMSFTIAGGKIIAIDILADPERLGHLDLSALGG
jgi:RNA polymerase sigma factor (sigma-70 family)